MKKVKMLNKKYKKQNPKFKIKKNKIMMIIIGKQLHNKKQMKYLRNYQQNY